MEPLTRLNYDYYELQDLFWKAEAALASRLGQPSTEIRLYLEVILSAVKANDLDYFLGEVFEYHCYLVGLDHNLLRETIIAEALMIAKKRSKYTPRLAHLARPDIIDKHNRGMSMTSIAEEYDISVKTVKKLLDPTYITQHSIQNLKAKSIRINLENGITKKEIAEKYNLSERSVNRILKKYK